jgi:hypothetical protein
MSGNMIILEDDTCQCSDTKRSKTCWQRKTAKARPTCRCPWKMWQDVRSTSCHHDADSGAGAREKQVQVGLRVWPKDHFYPPDTSVKMLQGIRIEHEKIWRHGGQCVNSGVYDEGDEVVVGELLNPRSVRIYSDTSRLIPLLIYRNTSLVQECCSYPTLLDPTTDCSKL